jgi:hypothetical protein
VEVAVSANQKEDGPELYESKMMAGYQELVGRVDAVI